MTVARFVKKWKMVDRDRDLVTTPDLQYASERKLHSVKVPLLVVSHVICVTMW